MKHKHLLRLAVTLFTTLFFVITIVIATPWWAEASVAPLTRYQQTYSVTLMSDLVTIRGAQPGYIAACEENGKAYVAQPAAAYAVSPPRVIAGADGIVWVDFLTIASPVTSSFIGSILFSQIVPSSLPTAGSAHGITDLAPKSRTVTGTAPITVNGAASATLTNDITLGITYGTTASSVSLGGSNAPGTSSSAARADHVHAAPAIGTVAGTIAAGNDSRFTNDRVASGLRSATTVVDVSSAAAPSANQVLTALSSTSATWKLIVNGSIDPSAAIDVTKLATGPVGQVLRGGTYNAWGQVQWSEVAGKPSAFSPSPHAGTHYPGGSDPISLATTTSPGFVIAQGTTANRFLSTNGSGTMAFTTVPWGSLSGYPTLTTTAPLTIAGTTSADISTNRTLAVNNATTSTTGVVQLAGDLGGTATAPSVLKLRGAAIGTTAGALPSGVVMMATGASACDWNYLRDSSFASDAAIGWAKINHPATFPPSAHASTHLTGGSDPIQEATGLAAGLMPASAMAKLNGIPYPAGGADDGKLVRATGTPGQYTLSSTATIGLVTGSGTTGAVPKFTGQRALGDSSITDNGAGVVTVNGVVQARNFGLYATTSAAQWVRVGTFTASQQGRTISVIAHVHAGYNASNTQSTELHITFKTSNGSGDANGFAGDGSYFTFGKNSWFSPGRVKWKANAAGGTATAFDLYLYLPQYAEGSHYSVTVDNNSTWTDGQLGGQTDPGAASSTVLIPEQYFSVSGLTGITFPASAVRPTITQEIATGASPSQLIIEAQSATDSNWYFYSGDVQINAGTNAAGAKGCVSLGYHDNPGAYGSFCDGGASVNGGIGARAMTLDTTDVGGGKVVIDPGGFQGKEFTVFRSFSTNLGGAGPVGVNFTDTDSTLTAGHTYHAVITIAVNGAIQRTFQATATWAKESNGVLHGVEYNTFGNGGNVAVGQDSSPDQNTMRFIVGAPAGACNWKLKFQVLEN